MVPSRTQLELVALAVTGWCLLLVPHAIETPAGPTSLAYGVGVDLVVVALALGYGYRVGKAGRAGSPRAVAREYLVAGLVGTVAFLVIGMVAFDFSWQLQWFDFVLVLRTTVDFVVPFVLAGLAGVPLGAMDGRRSTPASAVDADSETVAAADN